MAEFPDVPVTHWAHRFIDVVTDLGLMNGYPDGTFQPERKLERDEAATLVYNIAVKAGWVDIEPPTDPDTTPPIITLLGDPNMVVLQGTPFDDPGAIAVDAVDGEVPVTVHGSVDVAVPDIYELEYRAVDRAGNQAVVWRVVTVEQFIPPGLPDFDAIVDVGVDAQSLVDRAGDGATIGVAPGVHTGFGVSPKHHQTFRPTEPDQRTVLDGRGRGFAFVSPNMVAAGVTIEGFEISGYQPGYQRGAVDAHYAGVPSDQFRDGGWHIVDCWIHHNAGAGIYVAGNDVLIAGNRVEDNTQLGVLAKHGKRGRVAGNTIARNNEAGTYNWGGEAGGTKFWNTRDLVIEDNESFGNDGPGLWSDWNNAGTVYRRNRIHDNIGAPGIFHEIGAGCQIYENHIWSNGFPDPSPDNVFRNRAAIVGMQPGHMQVWGNLIENCAKGIVLGHQCRTTGLPYSEFDPWTATAEVWGNRIVDGGLSKAATDCGGQVEMRWRSDNQLVGNSRVENVTVERI